MKIFQIILFIVTTNLIFSQGEFVVNYDFSSSSILKVSDKVDDVTFIYPGYNTFDENGSIFYFISSHEKRRIYGINTHTGEIEASIDASNIRSLEFSNSLNKLFAIETNQSENTKQFVMIDFSTSDRVPLGSKIGNSVMFQGFDSFNDKDTLFTFTTPPNSLTSISPNTGEVVYNPTIGILAGQSIQHYDYDSESGILYALVSENQGSSVFLATINIETGNVTKIGPSIGNLGIGGSSAINSNEKLYLYIHRSSGKYIVSSISLETGKNIANFDFSLDSQDNLHDLEYDNVSDKLYSKHWDANITNPTSVDNIEYPKIYPNPTSDFVYFKNLNTSEFLFVDIFSANGNLISSNIPMRNQRIDVHDLKGGVYFANIKSNTKTILIHKFVKN